MKLIHNIVHTAFIAGIALTAMTSCAEIEYFYGTAEAGEEAFAEILNPEGETVNSLGFTRDAYEEIMEVKSNSSWTASSSDEDWCIVNPSSAHGHGRLVVRIEKNENIKGRTAFVYVNGYDGRTLAKIDIRQAGLPLLSESSIEMPAFKSSHVLTVAAEGAWTAAVDPSCTWCTVSDNEGDAGASELSVMVTYNDTGAERKTSVVFDHAGVEERLEVVQSAEMESLAMEVKDGDILSVNWNPIKGAIGYEVTITPEGEESLSCDFDASVSSMQISGKGVEKKFDGWADIRVKAVTEDEEHPVQSEASRVHALFSSEYAESDGTSPEKAFRISNRRHLANVLEYPESYFIMTDDVDLEGYDSDEDGSNGNISMINEFSGDFDGNGKCVRNMVLKISGEASGPMGLFSAVSGTVRNLSFDNASVAFGAGGVAGLLCGSLTGKIENCTVSGSAVSRSTGNVLGIFAGEIDGGGMVESCSSLGNTISAESNNNVGGIAGRLKEGKVLKCGNTSSVRCSVSGGGVVGVQQGGTVECCFSTGEITAAKNSAGGIAGTMDKGAVLHDCYNTGKVSAQSSLGGICGQLKASSEIQYCYNTGELVKTETFGYIAGNVNKSTVKDCHCLRQDGITATDGVTEHDDAGMRKEETFSGWDFESVWFVSSTGYPYPQLKDNIHK